MVSRRKILSRSRDDLHMEAPVPEDEEDIWYHKEKLYKVRTKVISEKPFSNNHNSSNIIEMMCIDPSKTLQNASGRVWKNRILQL